MDDDCIDSDGEVSNTKKKRDSAENVPVSVSEEEETQMESEDEEKDTKAARRGTTTSAKQFAQAPTIKGEDCVSPPVDEEDNDNEEDNDDDTDENDDDEEDTNVDKEEDIFDFDLNDIKGMSEYELRRMQRVHRNNARLASLGLLGGMTSATTLSSHRSNRNKRVASQDDVERRVQPKRNAKLPTSYKDLDDHVIYKTRTPPIESSDTGEEDTVCKRMREDKAEYSPSGDGDNEEENDKEEEDEDKVGPSRGNDEEEYDEDKDELESGEFNSHILQMSLLSTSDSQPLNPCKRRSSSP
jgi:hypothetical protein